MSAPSDHTDRVCALIRAVRKPDRRCIIGVAGPPASGKSTLAEAVVEKLVQDGTPTALLPMDGYHLDNPILEARGLLARKGAPETFDANGFCTAIAGLADASVTRYFPIFDRSRELAIANATAIEPDIKIVVVEGNYLLLKTPPWSRLKPLFDATVFIAPPRDILRDRLLARWNDHGLSPDEAAEKTTQNDLPNANLVLAHSAEADLTLT